MILDDIDDVTPAVLEVMARTKDPRLREIMESLVRHLHAFVRDVDLTEEEFRAATALLNRMGQQTTDDHNEFVLMAGSLGVSTLVCLMNNGMGRTETSQSLLGPFWRKNSPRVEQGGSLVRSPTPGPLMEARLLFIDLNGAPVEGAEVDIWHSSPVGLYDNQDEEAADYNLRGKFLTDAKGEVRFSSVRPARYPIPTHTTVGDLLEAQDRHPFRPAHIHALAYREGFKTLVSQIYVEETEYLNSDVQFGVTSALVARLQRQETPHPVAGDVEWFSLTYTLTMEPGEARLPEAPIK